MRLKKLELYGFKSFAQRTEIVFNEGITGIVGPNGSGKSNIGDAVRWVLGEQSAKTLRGASMQDVIFNGTQRRKPLGYCEVSLTFENEDRVLPMDYAEITVTRRVYRSGESEYFLNRSSCRLKDVVDLFRDTGIGKEGYSIIGQGRIDDILSRKGEDRRLVFEEAAGIVKFRARKEEADRKLGRTLENLSRVDDILEELQRQLTPLEEQAKNARIYLEMAARLKVLDLNLFLVRSDKMEAKLRETDRDLQNIRAVLEQTEQTIQEKNEKRDQRQAEIAALDAKISEAHGELMAGIEAVHQAQDAVRALRERQNSRRENAERLKSETAEADSRREELNRLKAEADGGSSDRSQALTEREAQLEAARRAEEEARAEEQRRETALEERKNAILDAVNRQAAVQNDQTRLKTMQSAMEQRLEEVNAGCEDMKRAQTALAEGAEEARERLRAEQAEETRLSDALKDVRARLEKADADVIEARSRYDSRLAQMRDMESRRNLLEEMSKDLEGYSGAVRNVVRYARERGDDRVYGPVSQLITVPKEYETAMDMVLGASQQHVVIRDEETAKAMIGYLRERKLGRATFLPVTTVKSRLLSEGEREVLKMPGCLGVASDLVQCDSLYRGVIENLLGRTVVADNMDHGIAIMRRGRQAFRLVTLQGDVMHSGGSITGGSVAGKTMNLFSRERELKELTEKLTAGQEELEGLLKAMRDGQADKESLKAQSADALEALHQQEIAVARETEHAQNAEEELNSHALRLRETEAAREQLMESLMQIREQLSMVTDRTETSGESREKMEKEAAELQQALTAARADSAEKAAETLRLTLEINDLQHELETLKRDRTRFEQDMNRIGEEQERRRRQLEALDLEEKKDGAEAEERQKDLEKAQAEQSRRESIVKELEESRSTRQEQLRELMADAEALHQSYSRDSEKAHRLELSRARTDGDLKTLQERIWNTYELTYAGAEEFRQTEGFSVAEADREAAQLNTEIRALGPVNVHAVEDYAETKGRYDEMMVQRKDLEQAEADLRDLIEKLLKQMEETFVERFTLLKDYFSETFVRLFGGGHAELSLTDPSDPLNCGIEINAQPPGKKLQLLSLLSGGERTLTAIAILFATLKLKPTPFCILDEIEAALDDANIGYFADYLAEYSHSTQFVVVTHRKGTMERADSLYGVAMEEQGVSKMVSVSLKDYQE